jgi:MFS family permease
MGGTRVTKRRHGIIFMVFLVIFINYMDRVNFAVSIPAIREEFGFSLENIGQISFAWAIVYALFNFPGGWIADRLGLRWGLSAALGWWSAFTIATPLARRDGDLDGRTWPYGRGRSPDLVVQRQDRPKLGGAQ